VALIAGDGSPHRLLLAPIWIEGTAGGCKLNYAWDVRTREAPLFSLAFQVTRSEAQARRAP
jgi:hypothetical protein